MINRSLSKRKIKFSEFNNEEMIFFNRNNDTIYSGINNLEKLLDNITLDILSSFSNKVGEFPLSKSNSIFQSKFQKTPSFNNQDIIYFELSLNINKWKKGFIKLIDSNLARVIFILERNIKEVKYINHDILAKNELTSDIEKIIRKNDHSIELNVKIL